MYNSQLGQDKLVDIFLNYKYNGFFLDIGGSHYQHWNNTYFLEKHRNWKGIGIELDISYRNEWEKNRKNSVLINSDAFRIDYFQLFKKYDVPNHIDFLSLDLDPPEITLDVLFKIFNSGNTFSIISFEVDDYKYRGTKQKSRDFLTSKGYNLISELYNKDSYAKPSSPHIIHVDDFWISKSLYDSIEYDHCELLLESLMLYP